MDINISLNETEVCKQETTSRYQHFWIVTISVIMFCNLFLLIAILKSWTALRRNVVNRYLVSCLLSAIAFCAASAYEILYTIHHADETYLGESVLRSFNATHGLHTVIMQRYAYRKGLLPILALVMQYNITALVYAVSENAVFIGRHTNPDVVNNIDTPPRAQGRMKTRVCATSSRSIKPIIVCVLSWAVPLLCSIPVAFDWNCVEHCKCLPAYRWISTCQPDSEDSRICSRTWLPVSQSFVIFITALSWTAIILNFSLLTYTIRKFHRTHAPRDRFHFSEVLPSTPCNAGFRNWATNMRQKFAASIFCLCVVYTASIFDDHRFLSLYADPVSCATDSYSRGLSNAMPPLPGMSSSIFSAIDDKKRKNSRRNRIRPPMDRTIKLLIALSISMFVSVTPLIMIWFLDIVLVSDVSGGIGFPIALSFSYVYCAVLPFILLKFMFGLQRASQSFFYKCPCLRKTVVTSRRT